MTPKDLDQLIHRVVQQALWQQPPFQPQATGIPRSSVEAHPVSPALSPGARGSQVIVSAQRDAALPWEDSHESRIGEAPLLD